MSPVWAFDSAIVRTPAQSVAAGLRANEGPDPSPGGVQAEHRGYVETLEACGVAVETLPPLEAFPDSVFVEDPAFVLSEGAILLRPGAPSRAGEAAELAPVLRRRFDRVLELDRGRADGGDILILPDEIFIGLSARTDAAGAERFVELAASLGRRVRIVATPPGVLHLKSACALVDGETLVATAAMAAAGIFDDFEILILPDEEAAAANMIRVNDRLLVAAGYPRTIELIAQRGLEVVPLETREIARIDAGLSCMSLRWRAA